VFRYWNVIDGQFVEDTARQRLTAVEAPLRADVSRDGRIDADDAALSRAGRPFRFWVNEDSEKGDYVGQVADATSNASDLKVNGKLDLVNLFPVVVDLTAFEEAWGAAATAIRASTSARLRYCVLGDGFSFENALGLATAAVTTADGTPLESATLTPLSDDGVDIGELSGGSLTSPVALAFEAAGAVDGGLTLDVLVGGSVVYSCSLPMAISSVDAMYRHADLRGAAENAAFAPTVPTEPRNGPDDETDGRHFVFVHGYNVGAAASRAWARSMFKRLWWADSRAAFTAIDWKGDDSQMSVPAKGDISPNYYVNVKNAFMTADALTRLCRMLSGEKVMLAHSLGNVLVSSAAVDHGLMYLRYYMLNAAVPMEAYDEGEKDDLMVDGAWKGVDERFRSSRFSDLFNSTTNDFRWGLSWKGRFNGIRNAINCYSPTEDVLANPSHVKVFGVQSEDFGGAWAKQELFKGCALWYGVNAATFAGAAIEGGWGVNARFVANPLAYVPLVGFNASYFERYTREDLIASPLYTSFDDERMASTNLLAFADDALRAKMLGDAIPAESFAVGANETRGVDDNYDMQGVQPNGWPKDRIKDGVAAWRHSDIKDVALSYVFHLFQLLKKGGSE